MTGVIEKWAAALNTFDRIMYNFQAAGHVKKALNSVPLGERVLLSEALTQI